MEPASGPQLREHKAMESSKESIRLGLVRRAVASGLAVLATGFLFTSVALVFTNPGSATATQVARLSAA